MDEHRQYVRINRFLEIHYRILKSMMKTGSSSKDISAGGICFPVFQNMQPGTILELEIDSEEIGGHIKATGEIRWIRKKEDIHYPYEIGIAFININPADRDKLINYVKERSKDRGPGKIDWLQDGR